MPIPFLGRSIPVRLPTVLEGFNQTEVELIEPLPIEFQDAAPDILRPEAALHWINAHHHRSSIARHGLLIFESLDTLDLAYETFACTLLTAPLPTVEQPACQSGRHGAGPRRAPGGCRRGRAGAMSALWFPGSRPARALLPQVRDAHARVI